jgi:hypothetical protein
MFVLLSMMGVFSGMLKPSFRMTCSFITPTFCGFMTIPSSRKKKSYVWGMNHLFALEVSMQSPNSLFAMVERYFP